MENLKNNKLTIITPSYRIKNLHEIKKSLNFEYIDEWIIVYDGNKIKSNPIIKRALYGGRNGAFSHG